MAVIFGASTSGMIIKLRCPKRGEVQARARAPRGTRYDCRKCGHSFTKDEGTVKPSSKPCR